MKKNYENMSCCNDIIINQEFVKKNDSAQPVEYKLLSTFLCSKGFLVLVTIGRLYN